MKRNFALCSLATLLIAVLTGACTTGTDNVSLGYDTVTSYSSTMVSAFKLGNNDDVLYNLDSVFFAIDQDLGLIYNADSLPKGTDVSKLTVEITFPSTVEKAEFKILDATVQGDTVIEYTSESNDTIDFTGNTRLVVTAYNGQNQRTYTVKVNVHQMEPDSLAWNINDRRYLPNTDSEVDASKMVKMTDTFYCLTHDRKGYVISNAATPQQGTWAAVTPDFGFTPNVKSFTASDDALYILSTDAQLYTSLDGGATWSDCGVAWTSIKAAHGTQALGVMVNEQGQYMLDKYPRNGYEPQVAPETFPVDGSSEFVMASNTWTSTQQGMLVGGKTASNEITNAVWGYDGKRWAKISADNSKLPAIEAPALFSYIVCSEDSTTHRVTQSEVWVVMGGIKSSGALNTETYVSFNQGITWSSAGLKMQIPSYMPNFYGAQAFVVNETLGNKVQSRITKPITEWDVPYIYLCGGYNASNQALYSIWKGAINRLTFKPIY